MTFSTVNVEIGKVVMVANGNNWDAHVSLKTTNPSLDLGVLEIKNLSSPEEFQERFGSEFSDYLEKLDGISVTH